jgi:putative copper resistance protein D
MLELAVIILRLIQYGAASILAGSALFFVYALPAEGSHSAAARGWAKPLLITAALVLTVAALLGLIAQTAVMAGSIAEGLAAESLMAVLGGISLGKAAVIRAALACTAAVSLIIMKPGRPLWAITAGAGSLSAATLAWMGHGAATEGGGYLPHLIADILHVLAAAGWVGALVAFVLLIRERKPTPGDLHVTHQALHRFSAVGSALVATLIATGIVNGWFLVGADLSTALQTAYGQLLMLKLALFAGMLALAALHRQRSVPALARDHSAEGFSPQAGIVSLQRSLLAEAMLGFGILALVAWLGTLSPPTTV